MSVLALTRVSYDVFVEDEIQELGKQALKIFKQQPGFLGCRHYQVNNAREIITLVEWASEADYAANKESRDWLFLMPQWCALQEEGDIQIETKLLVELNDPE